MVWGNLSIVCCPVTLKTSEWHLWAQRRGVEPGWWAVVRRKSQGVLVREGGWGSGTGKILRIQWSRKKRGIGSKRETRATYKKSEQGSELKPFGQLGGEYQWMSAIITESLWATESYEMARKNYSQNGQLVKNEEIMNWERQAETGRRNQDIHRNPREKTKIETRTWANRHKNQIQREHNMWPTFCFPVKPPVDITPRKNLFQGQPMAWGGRCVSFHSKRESGDGQSRHRWCTLWSVS